MYHAYFSVVSLVIQPQMPLVPLRSGRVSGKRLSSGKVLTSSEVFKNTYIGRKVHTNVFLHYCRKAPVFSDIFYGTEWPSHFGNKLLGTLNCSIKFLMGLAAFFPLMWYVMIHHAV